MQTRDRTVRRNTIALLGDFVLFGLGFAFFDPLVVVPTFVHQFTGSDLMVGVLAALRVLAITVPQLWAASVLVARPYKRPLLIGSSIGGRLPIVFLVAATALWAGASPWRAVAVLGLAVAAFYTSEGLNGISWPALVGKVVPPSIRGRFFGFGQLFTSLAALGAGYVVRLPAWAGRGVLPGALGDPVWPFPGRVHALGGEHVFYPGRAGPRGRAKGGPGPLAAGDGRLCADRKLAATGGRLAARPGHGSGHFCVLCRARPGADPGAATG